MAFAIDRLNGQNFADNIVNSALYFDSGTWTVVQGTGNVTLDANSALSGNKSLKITSTTPSTDVLVSNAVQDTNIVLSGDYQLTWFAKKNIVQEVRSGAVLIFQNGSPLNTQSFEIGSTVAEDDDNDTWVRFQTDTNYTFTKGDVITFQFGLSAATTSELSTFINIDGVMLNQADRKNGIAPAYNKSRNTLELFGVYDYNDSSTILSPIILTDANTQYQLTNDGLGAFTNKQFVLSSVDDLWDANTNRFDFTDLEFGDTVDLRIDLTYTTAQTNTAINLDLELGLGLFPYQLRMIDEENKKDADTYNHVIFFSVYMGDTNTLNSPARLLMEADKPGVTVIVNGWYLRAMKRVI